MEVLLRSLYGATAVMAVPRRIGPTRDDTAEVLNMLKVSAVPPRRSAVLQFSAVLRRSMTESPRNHGGHGGATAVYVVQAPQWHRAFGVTGVVLRRHGGTC